MPNAAQKECAWKTVRLGETEKINIKKEGGKLYIQEPRNRGIAKTRGGVADCGH